VKRLEADVETELAALVAEEGLRLLAAEISGSGPKTILRLVVDGPDGVSLDQCATISRQASALLDVEDPFPHPYTLEVSSPGLERKFYEREDYHRFAGERVKVRMAPSFRDHRTVRGRLLDLEGEHVRVQTDAEAIVELPYEHVFETRLEIDWASELNEGNRRR
jgi:ribosome maturation factor RimP